MGRCAEVMTGGSLEVTESPFDAFNAVIIRHVIAVHPTAALPMHSEKQSG